MSRDSLFLSHTNVVNHYSPSKIVVENNLAPTAETAKLYGDLLQKAQESILDTIEIRNNVFNGSAVVFKVMDHASFGYAIRIVWRFTLNGQNFDGSTDKPLGYKYSRMDVIEELFREMATEIAVSLVTKCDFGEFV